MAQCKMPLFPAYPDSWICILEEGHEENLHRTYTVRNEDVYFQAKERD